MRIREATSKGYDEAENGDSINISFLISNTRRGRVGHQIANTLDGGGGNTIGVLDNGRIRKLTPKECMRLQGVDDEVTDRLIEAGISDAQLYRASGDAVTIPVVYEIAKRMIEIWEEEQNNG